MITHKDELDEAFLATIHAWMRKSAQDDVQGESKRQSCWGYRLEARYGAFASTSASIVRGSSVAGVESRPDSTLGEQLDDRGAIHVELSG